MKRATVLICAAVCALGFPAILWLVFYRAPLIDSAQLYFNQKIFYFHVPCALMVYTSVFVCGVYSILYLRKRQPKHDEMAYAGAVLGVVFGAIMLVTGSIWAKAAWSHWWEWEARLTTALLLWIILLSYVLVRKYGGPGSERLAAGLAVFAMVDVPLIHVSVHIWNKVHPKTSVVPSLQGDMRTAFWSSLLVFVALFILLLKTRAAMGRVERHINEIRERALDTGLME